LFILIQCFILEFVGGALSHKWKQINSYVNSVKNGFELSVSNNLNIGFHWNK